MSTTVPEDLQSEIGQLESDSSRPSRFSNAVMNLCTKIAIAEFSPDELTKIRGVVEAFEYMHFEEKIKVVPEKEKRKEIAQIRILAICLSQMQELAPTQYYRTRQFMIPWAISSGDEAFKFFSPFLLRPLAPEDWSQSYVKALARLEEKAMREYCDWILEETLNGSDIHRCFDLKVQFLIWAVPIVEDLARKILESTEAGAYWETVLAVMGKGKADSKISFGAFGQK